jgi:hypothetical protein
MALSGISGVSGISGIAGVADEGIPLPSLNTTDLLARFTTDEVSRFTIVNTDKVTTWSPTQVGVGTFDLVRSNTVDAQSPVYLADVGGKPALNIGFNNKALHANAVNAAFSNTGITTHCVIQFSEVRAGVILRYFNPGNNYYVDSSTRGLGAINRIKVNIFDGFVSGYEGGSINTNTLALVTHTHLPTNRHVVRVNGTEILNSFEQSHYNTVGSGQRLSVGGHGVGTVLSECANAAVFDISWYKTYNLSRIQNVENTLAEYYGITLP